MQNTGTERILIKTSILLLIEYICDVEGGPKIETVLKINITDDEVDNSKDKEISKSKEHIDTTKFDLGILPIKLIDDDDGVTFNLKIDNNDSNIEDIYTEYNIRNDFDIHTDYLKDSYEKPSNNIDGFWDGEIESDSMEPNTRRVYNSISTKIKHYPFMASIHLMGEFHCAGVIIGPDLILTACSCVQLLWNNRFYRENPRVLQVRAGSTYFAEGGEIFPVLEVFFHPNYTPKTLAHNIAILRITRRLNFKKKVVKKIRLGTSRIMEDETVKVRLLGWGARTRGNLIQNRKLSYSDLPIYPLSECRKVYYNKFVPDTNFCGGRFSQGGGACNGDMGAPGVIDDELVGIVSFGPPVCGAPDFPTVFTNVKYYVSWIRRIQKEIPEKIRIRKSSSETSSSDDRSSTESDYTSIETYYDKLFGRRGSNEFEIKKTTKTVVKNNLYDLQKPKVNTANDIIHNDAAQEETTELTDLVSNLADGNKKSKALEEISKKIRNLVLEKPLTNQGLDVDTTAFVRNGVTKMQAERKILNPFEALGLSSLLQPKTGDKNQKSKDIIMLYLPDKEADKLSLSINEDKSTQGTTSVGFATSSPLVENNNFHSTGISTDAEGMSFER